MIRAVRNLPLNTSAMSSAEFAMVLPLLLIFLFGMIDTGRFLWEFNEAEKATQVGARMAIVTNVLWGRIGDKFGWMRQMRWYGCVGCAVATLAFYYLPQWTGPNMIALSAAAVLLAVAVSAFVPMGAVFPALAPEHTGAARLAAKRAAAEAGEDLG